MAKSTNTAAVKQDNAAASTIEVAKKELFTRVIKRITEMNQLGEIHIPKDYSPENAIKQALLVIEDMETKDYKPVLAVASNASIHNALLKMTMEGLSVGKKQGYFVLFGKKLEFMRSYFGDEHVAKRAGANEINAVCVYEGDVVKVIMKRGKIADIQHETEFANRNNKIIGCYGFVEMEDGKTYYDMMSWNEIQKSWEQASGGIGKTHKNFPERMARRTMKRRMATEIFNTSDDSSIMDNGDQNDNTETNDMHAYEDIEHVVEHEANTIPLTINEDSGEVAEAEVVEAEELAPSEPIRKTKEPKKEEIKNNNPEDLDF